MFAFQFKPLEQETHARDIAGRRANMSLYSPDKAMINGIAAPWMPGDLPTRDWGAIRATYWGVDEKSGVAQFQLGRFDRLARFFASSRAAQHFPSAAPAVDAAVAVVPTPPPSQGERSDGEKPAIAG